MSRPALLFQHVVGAILLFSTYITAFTTRALAEPTRDRAIGDGSRWPECRSS